MSVLHEVAQKLHALGLGTYADGGSIVAGPHTDEPDVCCSVMTYPGLGGLRGLGSASYRVETPAIQVVFRGVADDLDGPDAQAQLAHLLLSQVMTETLVSDKSSAFYHWITANQPPYEQKKDEKNRHYVAINFLCEKEPSVPL